MVYNQVTIENLSDNQNLPKNTDGWDSYNVDGLTVRDAWVNIGDDCFSPKPNTTNIYVENLYCNGTHGVSMGSIGQYPGVKDYISNAVVKNVVMLNAEVSFVVYCLLLRSVVDVPFFFDLSRVRAKSTLSSTVNSCHALAFKIMLLCLAQVTIVHLTQPRGIVDHKRVSLAGVIVVQVDNLSSLEVYILLRAGG